MATEEKNKATATMSKQHRNRFRLKHWQVVSILLAVYDVIAICLAYFLALWLRFDGRFNAIPLLYLGPYQKFILPYALCCIVAFIPLKMYNSMWRFASYVELARTLWASVLTSIVHTVAIHLIFWRMPISYYLMGAFFQFVLLLLPRFGFRFLYIWRESRYKNSSGNRVMLIGAGSAGQMIVRDLAHAKEVNERVVCIIDDNSNKWNRTIDGIPIVGGREQILEAVQSYNVNRIYLAIPSASMQDKRDILAICNETGCELKQLPGMYQFVLGQITASAMKDVSVEDLLGREPIRADMSEVFDFINGKTVLVTGAGGSIGSELCRQIAAHNPKALILFDIYENSVYSLQLELKKKYPDLRMEVLIGSVRDSRRIEGVCLEYRPEIIYHAAAHKHVPLMEDSPCEAIKNNTLGTYKTAYAAMLSGCQRFVLISTDKAVNPTNVMGASKRLCEMVVQTFDAYVKEGRASELPRLCSHPALPEETQAEALKNAKTEFVAVRFGNVLGSNGSVIPIFKEQIERGGPVTVTHPDIVRYFMTIPEAVSLVMLAGTYAHGGEIFVLDMGSPVKIDTLARNLIRLAGFKPDVDIPIEYTGLRPGEKLYEEKLLAEEGLQKTANDMIWVGNPVVFNKGIFLNQLIKLAGLAMANDPTIRDTICSIIPSYK